MPEWGELQRKTGQRGLLIASYRRFEKELCKGLLLWQRLSVSLHTWGHQGPRKPSSCATFTLNSHWGTAAAGKSSLVQGHFSIVQIFETMWTVASLSGRGFTRQEYWSILANTGCHALLEHYSSCCPSCQLP